MPLIIVTGYPTAGKTHRATQLASYFSSLPNPPRIHHITDTSLAIPHTVYDLSSAGAHERSANASEKDARARVYAEVKRHLSPNDLVICDAAGGNYIKGWRYQLFCEAKALRTPCCVVHVGMPVETAKEVNEARLAARERGEEGQGEPYEKETWDNLVFRYEEPNGMVRWDSPLFTVGWEDAEIDFEAIKEAVLGGGVVRPNAATVATKHVEEGYLYRLDRETQAVVSKILEWVKDHEGEEGGVIDMEEEAQRKVRLAGKKGRRDEDETEEGGGLELALPQVKLGVPVLQRLRRQYIQLQRLEPSGAGRVREGFIGFLNAAFEEM
ncbi:hypothetical protein VE00_03945 [Pseudogymnoascus sp. WSF 3629]|nr:hypothetical protein VE00_03945 [Pseudogymnoascus sp. WSF 3629]